VRDIARGFLFLPFLLVLAIVCLCLPQPAAYADESEVPQRQTAADEDFDGPSRQFQERRNRRRQEREEARRQQRERDAAAAAAAKDGVFALPAEFEKAWDYFSDHENRQRDVAVQLFEKCLEEHPDTIFRPEIYFRMGQLYCSHRNNKFGETYEPDLMEKYYQLAAEGYGLEYSHLNRTARASIVNRATKPLEDRLEYYEWLRQLEESIDADDMYAVVEMGILAQGHRTSPYWSPEERQRQAETLKKQLPELIHVAEKNIFFKSTVGELRDVAKLYPRTELARQAQMRVDRWETDVTEHLLDGLVNEELDVSAEARADHEDITQVAGSSEVPPEPTPPNATVARAAPRSSAAFPTKLLVGGGVGLLALATAVCLWSSSKTRAFLRRCRRDDG